MNRFALFVFAISALPANVRSDSYSYEFGGETVVELSLGTPDQGPFEFLWDPVMNMFTFPKPAVADLSGGGFYNPNSSSTFKFGHVLGEDGSFTGTETIKLLNGPELKAEDINVYHRDTLGYIHIGPGEEGNLSFMEHVLKRLGGKNTVLLAIKKSKTFIHYGTLILGDPRPSICQNSWITYPSHDESYIQMTLDVSEVQIGNQYHREVTSLIFDANFIWFDKRTYAAAVEALGVKETEEIDCDTDVQIKIRTAQHEWIIEPADYLEDWGGICRFSIVKSAADAIMLPLRFLEKQCIAFDFDMKTISLAPFA